MSMQSSPGYQPGQGSASLGDVTTQLQGIVRQLSNGNQNMLTLIATLQATVLGTFTLSAAATTVVAQPSVTAKSVVLAFPINAAAATLMGGVKSLYNSALTPGASFTMATANATNAAGTEQFGYAIFNPVS